jgi:hypothetical protein
MRTSELVKGSFRGAVKPMRSCSRRIAGPNVRTCHPQGLGLRFPRCMSWRWSRCWPNAMRTTRPIRRLARPSRASKRSPCTGCRQLAPSAAHALRGTAPKIIMVDHQVALAGSANLIGCAKESNLECGILIRSGPQPEPSVTTSPACTPQTSCFASEIFKYGPLLTRVFVPS